MKITKRSRFAIAKDDIVRYIDNLDKKVFTHRELGAILSEDNMLDWRLGESITVKEFINFLLESTRLEKTDFELPNQKYSRYIWGEVSDFELIQSVRAQGYFSHYTAMYFHNLTEQIPKSVYLNREQSKRSNPIAELEQSRIDFAFSRPARTTNQKARYKGWTIYFLEGMNTEQLGVIDFQDPHGGTARTTNIERTLIDATVRPVYAGGTHEVLKAYKIAADEVSVNKIGAMLQQIGYIYPYHQAIGFYLEKSSSYAENQINLMRRFPIKYDFYLTHNMKETEFSEKWRLFYPKGFV